MILGIASILLAAMLLFTIPALGEIACGETKWWQPGVAVLALLAMVTVLVLLLWIPVALLRFGFELLHSAGT